MKINLQINKMMIKMNKQRYFDMSFRYSRASWGVLGCLGCPGVIRLTRGRVWESEPTEYEGSVRKLNAHFCSAASHGCPRHSA